MRPVSCTIWILAALLVAATLDSLPDPPAVSPRTAICKIEQPEARVCDAMIGRGNSLAAMDFFPVSLTAADTCEPHPSSAPMVLAVHAADSSPPLASRA